MGRMWGASRSRRKVSGTRRPTMVAHEAYRTKIQIGSRTFFFVLPPPVIPAAPLTPDPSPDGETASLPGQTEVRPARASKRQLQSPSPRKRRKLHQYPASDLRLTLEPSSPTSPPDPIATPSTHASKTVRNRSRRHESEESGDDCDQPLVSIDDLQQEDLDDLQAMDRSGDELESEEETIPRSLPHSTKPKGKAAKSTTARKGKKGATKSTSSVRTPRPLPAGPSSSLHSPSVQNRPLPPEIRTSRVAARP